MPATAHAAWCRCPVSPCKASACASASRSWALRPARRARSSALVNAAAARAATMRRAAASASPWMRSRPRRTGRSPPAGGIDEAAVPVAMAHIDRQHLDAMRARIAHQLRRRVEAHRLAVQQRREKGVGVVALDPAADIDQQREAGRVALRKAVLAEALDLLEDALGELGRVALLDHAADQPVVERLEPAAALPRRHRAAQLVGLAGREVGREHRDLHHLLLEDRHAQGALSAGFSSSG